MQIGGSAADGPLKLLPWKRLSTALFILVALVTAGLVARHFVHTGWPLHRANLWLVGAAAVIFLGAYAAKAWGWQRLFRDAERPAVLTLAAAGGAASVGGIALPGRCDEVIRVAVVRRCRRRTASYAGIALSIIVLGLIDSAAMTPLAAVALAFVHLGGWLQVGLSIVVAAGVAAAGLVLALPRLSRVGFVARFRIGQWLKEHALPRREAVWAWAAVVLSWVLRSLATFVLLAALGLGADYALAVAFVCASAASAVLPVAPAGAAIQAGAGAAILVAAGVKADQALAFGIAAQAVLIAVGATFVLGLAAWHAEGRMSLALRRPAA
jgi:uncharacterized membrane protein YbhN (UPF0104 family)